MTNSTDSDPNSYQVGGTHYQAAIQHWDLVVHLKLDYFQGVATKYITRWRNKNGLEDLKKASHYVRKRIQLGAALPAHVGDVSGDSAALSYLGKFRAANELTEDESELVYLIADGYLLLALEKLELLIRNVETYGVPK